MDTPAGSSPLARGLQPEVRQSGRQPRIIPARAGFTPSPTLSLSSTSDHPRSRGVYSTMNRRTPCPSGSSPLARGLLRFVFVLFLLHGIIPARAGFTSSWTAETPPRGDHPRSRGVYVIDSGYRGNLKGSSPLARGLLVTLVKDVAEVGIIPARAGFTVCASGRRPAPWDHPRSRGVYSAVRFIFLLRRGSSPLARGLRRRAGRVSAGWRIIPARAGFTR